MVSVDIENYKQQNLTRYVVLTEYCVRISSEFL